MGLSLEALTGGLTLKGLAKGRSDIFHIDPRDIRQKEGWNSRSADDPDNKEHVESLALSIAEIGVQEPLTVFREGGVIYVSDGHCRLAAALLAIQRGAEIKSVPVKTEGRGASEVDFVLSQITRNSGKPLTPFEQGHVYKRLLGYGWLVGDIAKRAGKSDSHVNACLDLQGAPQQIRNLVASGAVAPSLAMKVMKGRTPEEATTTLNNAVDTAHQQGQSRATARHIGQEPKAGKKHPLTRMRELFSEEAGTDVDTSGARTIITVSESVWAEIARLCAGASGCGHMNARTEE